MAKARLAEFASFKDQVDAKHQARLKELARRCVQLLAWMWGHVLPRLWERWRRRWRHLYVRASQRQRLSTLGLRDMT